MMRSKQNSQTLLVGVQNDMANLKNILTGSYKFKLKISLISLLFGNLPKENMFLLKLIHEYL